MLVVVAVSGVSSCSRDAATEVPGLPYSPWAYDSSTDLPGVRECDENVNSYAVGEVSVTITGNAPADANAAARTICDAIQ